RLGRRGGGRGRAPTPPQASLQWALAMAIRMTKPWIELSPEAIKALPGQLGVYQLADPQGHVVFIGFAGGRSLFGLRSELERALRGGPPGATGFRSQGDHENTGPHPEGAVGPEAPDGAPPGAKTA